MSYMNSTTDSFSWDLENLLIPENLNVLTHSNESSASKQSIQPDSVTQHESVNQQHQQQQQLEQQPNRIASIDEIPQDIVPFVDIEETGPTPPKQILISDGGTTLKSSPESVFSDKSFAEKYQERRQKNNLASRKSREKRKSKNHGVLLEIEELSSSNERLKTKVKKLEESLEKVKAELFASFVPKKTA